MTGIFPKQQTFDQCNHNHSCIILVNSLFNQLTFHVFYIETFIPLLSLQNIEVVLAKLDVLPSLPPIHEHT